MAADDKRLVPAFELLVDGQKADPELAGSVIGIRCSDDMDRAARFQLHISDVGRKWTKSDKFKPGTAIEIKLGYVGQLKSVCKAEVQTLEVVLTPDGPTRLLVAGFDKGQGFTKGTQTKTYKDVKDSDLARQIAQRNGLSADVDDSKVVHDYVIQSNLSDYDFLVQRAAVAGFRFNVDGKKLGFKKPQIGQGSAAKLVWRENIGRFAMEVNTYDQVSKISSSGWDPDKMKNMTSPAKKGDEYGTQGGQVTGAQLVKKMFGEGQDICSALAKWRNGEGENVQPEIKIFAKAAGLHRRGKIHIRESNQARFDAQGFCPAQSFKRALLQNPKQFSLRSGRKRGDFIKNDGAVTAEFEAAKLALHRAGKSAAFVAEEFALDKLRRKTGAINFQERCVAARPEFMNQPREVILTAAAFAGNQERGGSACDFLREFK